jgi:hypothetical protein
MEAFCFGELLRTEETKISHPKEKEKIVSSRENWQPNKQEDEKKEKKKRANVSNYVNNNVPTPSVMVTCEKNVRISRVSVCLFICSERDESSV